MCAHPRGRGRIGKTALWSAGVAYGEERAFRILTCRSSQSETDLSYAGLADTLGEVPDEALETLPEVQRHALEVALLRAEPGEAPVGHRTVAAATLGTLRWFASTGPLILAFDDPPWLDGASRRTLAYAIRRLDEEPVGILAAVRAGEGLDDPLELSLAFSDDRLRRMEVGPLSARALGRLLDRRLGWAPEGSALFELHTVSGGNPLFALEIARASKANPEHSLIVPRNLREQVSAHLAALPVATREALVVAAALPRPTLDIIERASDQNEEALGPAVRAGTIEVRGDAVRFTHPLYASVVYADAPKEDRTRIHRVLADVVADPEARARHLALGVAPTDANVADALEEAAARARSRGAQVAAAELSLEARRFTPADRIDDLRQRALLAADDLYELGELSSMKTLLEDAVAGYPEGRERAQVLWRLGRLGSLGELMSLEDSDGFLDRAEGEAQDDMRLRSQIHRVRFWVASQRYQYSAATEDARAALELAGMVGDPAARAASLAMVSWAEMACGRGVAAAAITEALETWEAAARTPSGSLLALDEHPGYLCGQVLAGVDRLDEARLGFEAWRRDASEQESDVALFYALSWLFEVELLAGDWVLASRYVDEASRLQVDTKVTDLMRGTIAAHLGQADEARRELARGLEVAEPKGVIDTIDVFLSRLGFIELSLGNLGEAHRHLSQATRLFMDSGVLEPGFGRFLPDAIEVLVGRGELAEAERLTDWLEERGRALDRVSAFATGARCRGLLFGAKGEPLVALEHLERAMIEHERLPMPFQRARTLLVLGTVPPACQAEADRSRGS